MLKIWLNSLYPPSCLKGEFVSKHFYYDLLYFLEFQSLKLPHTDIEIALMVLPFILLYSPTFSKWSEPNAKTHMEPTYNLTYIVRN